MRLVEIALVVVYVITPQVFALASMDTTELNANTKPSLVKVVGSPLSKLHTFPPSKAN